MNKKKLISFGLLISSAALIVSISTTAAWFLGYSQLGVGCMDVHIGTKTFEIRPDDKQEFKMGLTKSDLMQVDYFIPCTSAFSSTWMNNKESEPVFRSAYTECASPFMTTVDQAPIAAKGYFSQALFIRSNSDCYVLVDPENTKIYPDYTRNAEKAAQLAGTSKYSKEEIEQQLNSLVHSMRIAILTLGYYGDHNELLDIEADYQFVIFDCFKYKNYNTVDQTVDKTYLGGIMDVDADGWYDSISGKEVLYGEVYNTDKTVYKDPGNADYNFKGEPTCFNAKHDESINTFDLEASLDNGLVIAEEKSLGIEEAGQFAMKMYSGKQRKFVLCIYIEGWDRENTNLTMYAAFKLEINFMAQDGLN